MPECIVCHQPGTHIEASCTMRHTITANGREFHQVEERMRWFCHDHHGDTTIPIQEPHMTTEPERRTAGDIPTHDGDRIIYLDRPKPPTPIDYDTVYDCYLPNGTAVRLGGLEMRMFGATLDRPQPRHARRHPEYFGPYRADPPDVFAHNPAIEEQP